VNEELQSLGEVTERPKVRHRKWRPTGACLSKLFSDKEMEEARMLDKAREQTPMKTPQAVRLQKAPELNEEEEQILKKAQIYLLFEAKRPMFWHVAAIRQEKGEVGSRRWIIAVHLRAPSGHEGYLGDLLFDGERFTELTDVELMRERVQRAADSGSPSPVA
jgi:hypothetical protein